MTKTVFQGKLSHRLRSAGVLLTTSLGVVARRAIGRPLVDAWSIPFEVGTLFYRRQFNHAFSLPDIAEGRAYFDSCYTLAGDMPPVEIRKSQPGEPAGEWFLPQGVSAAPTMLYFHGGGYTFHAAVTRNFIAMLAHALQIRVFSLDYRLTPEHAHPAQLDDALSAYRALLATGIKPSELVICGDSAGGHLVLMTLAALQAAALPQPMLALAISPWTHIGRLGASQFGNDRFDMVQGYQTLQYGQWLKGQGNWTDEALSPMGQDFGSTAPLYIQAGDKEILVDMIRVFARQAACRGACVRLDVWPHMTHEFHAYGDTEAESRHAIARLREAIDAAAALQNDKAAPLQRGSMHHAGDRITASADAVLFPPIDETEVNAWPAHVPVTSTGTASS